MNKLSKVISGITSPYLVIPIFSIITIFHYAKSIQNFMLWSVILIVLTVLLPLGYVFLSVKRNKMTDLHVFMKEQRTVPFVIAIVGSILTLFIYLFMKVPSALIAMTAALIINGAIFSVLSRYWKLSMHAATFLSSLTIVSILVSSIYWVLSPIIVLIIWARMQRKRHTFWQLIIAGLLSPILTYLVLKIFS